MLVQGQNLWIKNNNNNNGVMLGTRKSERAAAKLKEAEQHGRPIKHDHHDHQQ